MFTKRGSERESIEAIKSDGQRGSSAECWEDWSVAYLVIDKINNFVRFPHEKSGETEASFFVRWDFLSPSMTAT